MSQTDATGQSDTNESTPKKPADVLTKELKDAITSVLSQYEGDELIAQQADLMVMLERMEPDYQEAAVDMMPWSELNDKKRCDKLKLEPAKLDLGTYLQNGCVEQTVYLNEHLSVTFRSARPLDSQFLDAWTHIAGKNYQQVQEKSKTEQEDMLHLMDATPTAEAMNELAVSVQAINGKPIADVEDIYTIQEDGRLVPQLELAKKKRLFFDKMPTPVTTDIMIQMRLFNRRVHDLHSPGAVQAF